MKNSSVFLGESFQHKGRSYYGWLFDVFLHVLLVLKRAHFNKFQILLFYSAGWASTVGITQYSRMTYGLPFLHPLIAANVVFFFCINIFVLGIYSFLLDHRYLGDLKHIRKWPYGSEDFRDLILIWNAFHFLQLGVFFTAIKGEVLFLCSYGLVFLSFLLVVLKIIKPTPSSVRPVNFGLFVPSDDPLAREKKWIGSELHNAIEIKNQKQTLQTKPDPAAHQFETHVAVADGVNPELLGGNVKIQVNGDTVLDKPICLLGKGWNRLTVPRTPDDINKEQHISIETNEPMPVYVTPPRFSSSVPPEKQKNIILIVIDSLRKDEIGLYGSQFKASFAIDRFFEEGSIYESAYGQGEWTLPAFASMATSLYPSHHRVTHHDYNQCQHPPKDQETIAEALRRNNYYTFASISATRSSHLFGLDRGYHRFCIPLHRFDHRKITMDAIEVLNTHAHENKFMLLHYFDIHGGPFDLNPPFQWEGLEKMTVNPEKIIAQAKKGKPSNQEKYFRQLRMNKMKELNTSLDLLFSTLKQNPMFKNTAVILTSDHGTDLPGDKVANWTKKNMSEHRLNIPLLVHCPWQVGAQHQRFQGLVESSIDMGPSIADLAGIQMKSSSYSHSFIPQASQPNPSKDMAVSEMIFRGDYFCRIVSKTHEYQYIYNWFQKGPVKEVLIERATQTEISASEPHFKRLIEPFQAYRVSLNLYSKEKDINDYY